ncbi:fimbria/pilus chaperone family protein [Salmonella enterica]|uniref:Fimbrial chaperone n=3 Tax=Salmonella enterica TaxID=28901 RepID=A0A379QS23_SALER|nr:fimbria/pilus chaperone family protein [Salmonella enterica]ECC1479488.1 fimbria/pilus periplasmic chaperone [Salmonella enterica subsp. salamae]ASG89711.1 fimbrial chaperone protein [Salmonella enterica subsp. salamae serovar 55:k:z39 str. 1315K]ECC1657271.1 fimbria/pilus periplasmic chaperone [Salmonella enterica subsp. salamae]ECD9415609.1 fimbria/pilus periplasmic chaperone [Salmonella enterica subsp. salamae]ECF5932444.1 fimbria/pilus periplasmic chaperone [Salmonella enterica subsp. s
MSVLTKMSACALAAPLLFTTLFSQAYAAGMVPETTLLVIDESTHSGVMNVKNTDDFPALLYTTIVDLPDDTGVKLNVTQPVVRVEPNQQQQLRFIMESQQPLTVEHYKRVTFEGIPPKSTSKNIKIGFNMRQDLPVLIRPKNLPVVTDAWKLLQWSGSGQSFKVKNPSAYVVRLAQNVTFLPSNVQGGLKKTYILPGETMDVSVPKSLSGEKSVRFYPASRYGIEVPSFTAPLAQ